MTFQILLLSVGLAMDAFAVSITNGICNKSLSPQKNALFSGITFGVFQGLMPLLGYLLGSLFKDLVESIDHWVALVLLAAIGLKMIHDGIEERRNPEACVTTGFRLSTLLGQGVATSIDAMAVGIGFAVIHINIWVACASIALVTFTCSYVGVWIGHRFGRFLSDKAQFVGGAILIFIGINIFYEHVSVLVP